MLGHKTLHVGGNLQLLIDEVDNVKRLRLTPKARK